MEITPNVDRRANGWRAVLEFPNGGRQCFATRYGTLDEALRESERMAQTRNDHPEWVARGWLVPDPQPNQCVEY